jgi:hypothetical protein
MDEHAAQLAIPIEIGIDASSTAFLDTEAYRRARAAVATMASIEEEYFRRLPRLAMSCCPVCEKPLFRSFDPFGIDGLWWRSDASPARTNVVYTTQLGAHAWRRADEPAFANGPADVWDFAIEPRLAQAKVRWCDRGNDGSALTEGAPATCPFVGLPGVRQPQVVRAERL